MTVVERSQVLAEQFALAVAEFVGLVEGLSEEQWRTFCPSEHRSVAILTHHVASGIPFEMAIFREIANGGQPATISRAQLAEMNADDAGRWENCTKDETIALLRAIARSAASEVARLSEEQLTQSGHFITDAEAWTVGRWIERILIGHVEGHLRSIEEGLAS